MTNLVQMAGEKGSGLESALRKAVRHIEDVAVSEARHGHEMNLKHINDLMYQHVRNTVANHFGQLDPTTQQYVDAQLRKIERGVSPADIFPEKQ